MKEPSIFKHHNHDFLKFPKNFLWGVATSAHQVEGGNTNNDWFEWEKNPKHVWGAQRSGVASRHFERYREDAELSARINCNSYRMSIEWSRIEPRENEWDAAAFDHYRAVLQTYRHEGMKIVLTLHHFTNPLWFSERGGWLSNDAPRLFERFARRVAEELGSLVDIWITVNEPTLYASLSYYRGVWPPGKRSLFKAIRVGLHLATGHRRAYHAIHETRDTPTEQAMVGCAINMLSFSTYQYSWLDLIAMKIADWFVNHLFLNLTRRHHDFIGVNYYFHRRIARERGHWIARIVDARLSERREASDIGWEIYPQGISEVLQDVWSTYHLPIYLLENGIATDNEDKRARFLVSYLKEVYHAIRAGVDVRGYFYWSLIDNFEWEKGYAPRFGLYHVNYATGERTAKPSSRVFARMAKENGIDHDLLAFLGHGASVEDVL